MILLKSASVPRANVINHYFPAQLRLLFCHYRALILEYLFCFLLFLFYPLIYLFTHFISRSLYFLFCFLRWGLMYSDWPRTHYVLEDDLELLICVPLPGRCSDNRLLAPALPPTSLLSTFSPPSLPVLVSLLSVFIRPFCYSRLKHTDLMLWVVLLSSLVSK